MIKDKYINNLEKIKKFRPIDDAFFEKIAEDIGVCEEMLQVILGDKSLKVLEVVPQKSIKNLQGRSVRLDVLCLRRGGRLSNIEVQKSDDTNHLKRVRYNASCITANMMETGTNFDDVPELDMIYISQFDIFNKNKVIYHIEPSLVETNEIVDNGLHEIYVNTAVNDGSEVAQLMQCFLQTEVNDERFPKLSKRVNYLKNSEEGKHNMYSVSDELRDEGREEGIREAIGRMLTKLTIDDIVELGYDRELILDVKKEMAS